MQLIVVTDGWTWQTKENGKNGIWWWFRFELFILCFQLWIRWPSHEKPWTTSDHRFLWMKNKRKYTRNGFNEVIWHFFSFLLLHFTYFFSWKIIRLNHSQSTSRAETSSDKEIIHEINKKKHICSTWDMRLSNEWLWPQNKIQKATIF